MINLNLASSEPQSTTLTTITVLPPQGVFRLFRVELFSAHLKKCSATTIKIFIEPAREMTIRVNVEITCQALKNLLASTLPQAWG